MERILEPELMDDAAQALAYARADFADVNRGFVDRFRTMFPDLAVARPRPRRDVRGRRITAAQARLLQFPARGVHARRGRAPARAPASPAELPRRQRSPLGRHGPAPVTSVKRPWSGGGNAVRGRAGSPDSILMACSRRSGAPRVAGLLELVSCRLVRASAGSGPQRRGSFVPGRPRPAVSRPRTTPTGMPFRSTTASISPSA